MSILFKRKNRFFLRIYHNNNQYIHHYLLSNVRSRNRHPLAIRHDAIIYFRRQYKQPRRISSVCALPQFSHSLTFVCSFGKSQVFVHTVTINCRYLPETTRCGSLYEPFMPVAHRNDTVTKLLSQISTDNWLLY